MARPVAFTVRSLHSLHMSLYFSALLCPVKFYTKELLLLLSDIAYAPDSDSGSEEFDLDSLYTNFSPTCMRGPSFPAVS